MTNHNQTTEKQRQRKKAWQKLHIGKNNLMAKSSSQTMKDRGTAFLKCEKNYQPVCSVKIDVRNKMK